MNGIKDKNGNVLLDFELEKDVLWGNTSGTFTISPEFVPGALSDSSGGFQVSTSAVANELFYPTKNLVSTSHGSGSIKVYCYDSNKKYLGNIPNDTYYWSNSQIDMSKFPEGTRYVRIGCLEKNIPVVTFTYSCKGLINEINGISDELIYNKPKVLTVNHSKCYQANSFGYVQMGDMIVIQCTLAISSNDFGYGTPMTIGLPKPTRGLMVTGNVIKKGETQPTTYPFEITGAGNIVYRGSELLPNSSIIYVNGCYIRNLE